MSLLALSTGAIVGIVVAVIVVVILIGVAVWAISCRNAFVSLRNRAEEAWATVDVSLKKRYDLIPNLVEAVKGYEKHESGVFEAVTEARAMATAARTPAQVSQAESALTDALRQLFAVAESYPDLKASANFLQLQQQLDDAENRIAYARQSYNDCVYEYNTSIQTFPGNLMAPLGRFEPRDGFEVTDAEARSVPEVSF